MFDMPRYRPIQQLRSEWIMNDDIIDILFGDNVDRYMAQTLLEVIDQDILSTILDSTITERTIEQRTKYKDKPKNDLDQWLQRIGYNEE
jgi:hypothetical protein